MAQMYMNIFAIEINFNIVEMLWHQWHMEAFANEQVLFSLSQSRATQILLIFFSLNTYLLLSLQDS